MTIPTGSNFPVALDTDTNLFAVHDSLRLRLAEDYTPGATVITVEPNPEVMAKFPATGLVTLTEQVSDIDLRAISFFYESHTETQFRGLTILPGFVDCAKPKRLTNVTQNVMALHHNNLKDTLIAIENFIGVQGAVDTEPFGNTVEGRLNFLRRLVYTPRAWFSANKTQGIVPLTITFQDLSNRLGSGPVTWEWDFGDQDISVTASIISAISTVNPGDVNVQVMDLDGAAITKTYSRPGKYDVRLTVTNEFGTDTVVFPEMIHARIEAPAEAQIEFGAERTNQDIHTGSLTPVSEEDKEDIRFSNRLGTVPAGPFQLPPTIRSLANTFIDIYLPEGPRPTDATLSHAGEHLNNGGAPIDQITAYNWSLSDDMVHSNSPHCRASYSVGGIYDIRLRVDTDFGAYRITTYKNCIDIIERSNLWLFIMNQDGLSASAREYGLISETFKTAIRSADVLRDERFIDDTYNGDPYIADETARQLAKQEFRRNTGFAPCSTTPSGEQGRLFLCYCAGSEDMTDNAGMFAAQEVKGLFYDGFGDVYTNATTGISRPFGWVFLNNNGKCYFAFGADPAMVKNTNLTNQTLESVQLGEGTIGGLAPRQLTTANFLNGANDLLQNPTRSYDPATNEPETGRFSTYRACWKDQSGYILRNDDVGTFYKIKSFYKTEGTLGEPVINFRKLPDMPGLVKVEGQLVSMSDGVFFFTNSGSIAAYNDTTGVWETGSPGASSPSFRSLQDSAAADYDSPNQTLLAASDGDHMAYLSFDYSPNAYVKFNGQDLTFTALGSRPVGEQWIMGIF